MRNTSFCEEKKRRIFALSCIFFPTLAEDSSVLEGVAAPSLSNNLMWHRHGTLYTDWVGLPCLRVCTKYVTLQYHLCCTYKHICTCRVFCIATPSQNCRAAKVSSCKIACEQISHPLTFARRSHVSTPPHQVHPRQSLLASLLLHSHPSTLFQHDSLFLRF